jgi:hypothetical protein
VARAAAWGLAGLETDWMMRNLQPFADFQTGVGGVEAWVAGAADAALVARVPWQWCLSWAADLLLSLPHPR